MLKFPVTQLFAATFLIGCSQNQPSQITEIPEGYTEQQGDLLVDVNAFCNTVTEEYIYFDKLNGNFPLACDQARESIPKTSNGAERFRVLETLLDSLYDNHTMFGANAADSFQLIPSGAEFWIDNGKVSAVLPKSAAANAGLQIGDEIIDVNGLSIQGLELLRVEPKGIEPTETQKYWSLIGSAQGRRNQTRSIKVKRDEALLSISIGEQVSQPSRPNVEATLLEDGIAYLKINNRLGDMQTVADFDEALEKLKDANGWILDLRYTPGGGGTDIAVPIMSRFVEGKKPYQITEYKNGKTRVAKTKRGKKWTVEGPMAVLVGRWTGSMGEGMAIGFDSLNRATVVGNDMGRLAGGVDDFYFPKSGILYKIPTYNLTHIDGTNRHEWSPPVFAVSDNGNGPDLALEKAVQIVRNKK